MIRHSQKGVGIGTALLLAALLAVLSFGLAGITTSHVHLSGRAFQAQLASDAARSVVADTVAAIVEDQTVGLPDSTNQTFLFEGPEGSLARLTFSEEEAERLGIPLSVNNLEGTESVIGHDGAVVPPSGIQLVGVGEQKGLTRIIRTTLHRPAFPYAIAASGPIRFEGGVVVAGVDEESETDLDLAKEKAIAANVGSGSGDREAIYLGPDTTISGDVEAVGGIFRDPTRVEVLGEVLTNQGDLSVPEIDFSNYDLEEDEALELTESLYNDPLVVEGPVRREGDLTITNGLEMKSALLFVDGNLTVSGGLTGVGLVVVTGNTSVRGGARLDSNTLLALATKGDIELLGSGEEGSFFQGTVYTEGALTADRITLLGTLIAAGDPDSVVLHDTRFFETPRKGRVSFTIAGTPTDEGRTNTIRIDLHTGAIDAGTSQSHMSFQYVRELGDGHLINFSGVGIDPSADNSETSLTVRVNEFEDLVEAIRPIILVHDHTLMPREVAEIVDFQFQLELLEDLPDHTTLEGTVITFDPSTFLKFSDSLKVRHWHEI